MLVEEVWGAISVSVHPKAIQWGLGQGSVSGHWSCSDLTLVIHVFVHWALS